MCKSQKQYTWEEVAEHNSADDLYVAIRGKVYDVTKFKDTHPGGLETLLAAGGRDATQVFETYHSFRVKELLHKYEVGHLVTNELPTFPAPNEFFVAVKSRVDDYFKKTKQNPKYNHWMLVRYFAIFGTIFGSWAITLNTDSLPLQLLLCLPLGLACAMVGLMPMHDSSHFSFTHNPTVWFALGATHDFVNGASYLCWLYQHMLGHHPYTNIDGADPDIVTSENDVRRIKTSQPWYSFYVNQHIYVPILYAVLGLKTRFQDVTIVFGSKMNGAIRVNNPSPAQTYVFWGGKVFFALYRLVLPLALGMSLLRVIGLFLLSDAVTSYWLALTFQANHVVEDVAWPELDSKGNILRDWAEHQVDTTQDYAHESWFWNVFSGALNHQTTHHIVPQVNQYYYPEISPIVRQAAKEFNIPYHYKETYSEAIGGHLQHLYNLGHKTNE
ncbi:Delta(5) fatty acid desaturase [Sphaeroforma arctica JP610]|uniref:Delta(5) fatty acid desaturase n=1 Tax=Sphaeroforma arctica JP610 TaxID=667725 RepID=A0A0L0FSF1_9EUKA|nr:Delta(5) fatty acid desaturase [Sphaeroforma arctica JP610]KNC79629.1 Delta(5) fatty acid desaturase [Sphaeroforma arctica JP610]|eukprot:XP_014153531.1 Delta(5) fatty acid desaturase [Sphaeroforma arctica JP610]